MIGQAPSSVKGVRFCLESTGRRDARVRQRRAPQSAGAAAPPVQQEGRSRTSSISPSKASSRASSES